MTIKDGMKNVYRFIFAVMQVQITTATCNGTGFPSEWTTATPGVTYWFVTEDIKRHFSSNYVMTDYYTSTTLQYGSPPTCESEHYDSGTGYYYYLMFYTGDNVYSTSTNIQICHAFKQYGSVIREYFEDLQSSGVLSDAAECVDRFSSSTLSMALTKYNFQYVDCPFSFEEYNFTFSEGGNADFCSSSESSTAFIDYQTISLKSCYTLSATKANPFYGAFSCLSYWSAESRDTPSLGGFIVVEMYDIAQWPYCGRYKVSPEGVITMSLYLAFALDPFFPVFCDASQANDYYNAEETFTRMVFTPINTRTTALTTAIETVFMTSETSIKEMLPTQTTTGVEIATADTTSTSTTLVSSTETTIDSVGISDGNSTDSSTESTKDTSTEITASTTAQSNTISTTFTTEITNNSASASVEQSIWDNIVNLYWPWWILVGCSVVGLALLTCCMCYKCLRYRKKQTKVAAIREVKQETLKPSKSHKSNAEKTKVINVQEINKKKLKF